MEQQKKALGFALTAVFLWSTVAVPFNIGLRYFHFIHFLFITISIAVIVLFITILVQRKLDKLNRLSKRQIWQGLLSGFLNPFLYYLMLFKAYSILPAQIAQALNYTWPIMLVILSVPFLGQKLNWLSGITLLLGFFGVYLIASQGKPWPIQPAEPFGVFLAISSSVVWATYWLVNTRSKTDPVISLFLNFLAGWFFTLPLIFLVPLKLVTWIGWGAALYAGFFEMGITFVIWLTAMKLTMRTDKISNYVFLSPFISLLFIHHFLSERIYLTTLYGLILIILSIFLNRYLNRKSRG